MEQGRSVKLWFDRLGDFLEIGWSDRWAVNGSQFPGTDYWFEVDLTEDSHAVGLQLVGAIKFANSCDGETVMAADVQPHPVTVKYSPGPDLWDVQWGPDATDCLETPDAHVKARVDGHGQIRGVLISGLKSLEDEILNVDVYPVTPGAATA